MESAHTKRIYEERLCSVKIEVGDIVSYNFDREKDAFYRVDSISPHTGITNVSDGVYKRCDFVTNFKLLKKGDKKMKVYKAIEAHDLMSEGKLMLGQNGFIYKMEDGLIYSCETIEKPWMNCSFNINQFLIMTFTEYKMPLKYKVGDKVLVEVEITRVEPDDEYPYTIARRPYAKEEDIKGIDE